MLVNPFRPKGFIGKGDRYLPEIAENLVDFILDDEEVYNWETITLPDEKWEILADILVEFAEDLHNSIGIWNAYEEYNLDFFGTRLPLTLEPGCEIEPGTICPERISHLVWALASELGFFDTFSPDHSELRELSEELSDFLNESFEKVPRDSGVKKFLSTTVREGWEVKRRLLWMGTASYMFRLIFVNEIENPHEKKSLIGCTDDFICSAATSWSGLGVVDILAAVLDIAPERKAELRNWYERHMSLYRVTQVKKDFMEAVNLLNNTTYRIRTQDMLKEFCIGDIVFGSLVFWNGEWYWSGKQFRYNNMSDGELRAFLKEFYHKNSEIVYRSRKDLLEKAKEYMGDMGKAFIEHFRDRLVVFKDVESMTETTNRFYQKYNEMASSRYYTETGEKDHRKRQFEKSKMPPELLMSKGSVCVFFNPGVGTEIIPRFSYFESGLSKKGVKLTEPERKVIWNFIRSQEISPSFIREMIKKYGDESIAEAFLISDFRRHPFLEYLLRRFKGRYFRNVYPSVTLAGVFDQ